MAKILVITGEGTPNANEQSYLDYLDSAGHEAVSLADHASSLVNVTSLSPQLVIITNNAYFSQTPDLSSLDVPIICFDSDIARTSLKLASSGGVAAGTIITVVNENSPLAGGAANGARAVYNSAATNLRYITGPASGGQVIAHVGDATQPCLVLYPKGSALTSGTAANIRIFGFISSSSDYGELGDTVGKPMFQAWLNFCLDQGDTFAINSTSNFQRGQTFTINCANAGTSGTVTYGGVTLTTTSWSNTLITGNIPANIALKHGDNPLTVTNNQSETANRTVALSPPSGWQFINTTNPLNNSTSIFFQMQGGPAVTGTQVVFEAQTAGGRGVTVFSNGQFTNNFGSAAVAEDTFEAYAITPSGAIGITATITVDDPANDQGGGTVTNQYPFVVTPIGNISASVGQSITRNVSTNFADPESGPLTFRKVSGPAEVNVSSSGVITFTTYEPGTKQVVIGIEDEEGAEIQHEFYIVATSSIPAPSLPSVMLYTITEGNQTVGNLRAETHWESNVHSIAGTDAARFTIDQATGELRFITAPSFNSPNDSNQDNRYEFTLTITNAGGSATAPVVIVVEAVVQDTIPGSFSFGTVNGAISGNLYTKIAPITAMDAGVLMHVTNGSVSNDNQATWTTQPIEYVPGQSFVRAQITASSTAGAAVTRTVTVNAVSSVFTVVTRTSISPIVDLTQQIEITEIKIFDTDVKLSIVEKEIYQGDTLSFNCEVRPLEYQSGLKCDMYIKRFIDDTTAVFEKHFDSLDDEQDTLVGYLSTTDTMQIPPGDYHVVIRMYNDDLGLSKEFQGKIKILKTGVVH